MAPAGILATDEEMTWMTPITKYLENDILPNDRNQSRRIKKHAARYCISRGKLFRRSFSGPYLRCPTSTQVNMILKELHERECGSHSSGRSLVLRGRRAGYYWTTMAEYANQQRKY
ncbi:hypothetical protein N665_0123s0014 [Sinapis alba]|nr:hypothetical protein N665_0123s0014 [Sinapis alba]